MHVDLIVCPICLRVQRGSEWVEADLVIREIRTYALAALPELHDEMCQDCAESILRRRSQAEEEPIAA